MKLQMMAIVGTALVALLATSLPALGADHVQNTVETSIYAGTAKAKGKWFTLKSPWVRADAPEGYHVQEDRYAGYKLTVRAQRRARVSGTCAVIAWVTQWSSYEDQWVTVLEKEMTIRSTNSRSYSVTGSPEWFNNEHDPAYIGVATNGKCASVSAKLTHSLPYSFVADDDLYEE